MTPAAMKPPLAEPFSPLGTSLPGEGREGLGSEGWQARAVSTGVGVIRDLS
jgi:hypothetical protein